MFFIPMTSEMAQAFSGASGSSPKGNEAEDERVALEGRRPETLVAGGGELEIRDCLAFAHPGGPK
jgi:hypothetical protein